MDRDETCVSAHWNSFCPSLEFQCICFCISTQSQTIKQLFVTPQGFSWRPDSLQSEVHLPPYVSGSQLTRKVWKQLGFHPIINWLWSRFGSVIPPKVRLPEEKLLRIKASYSEPFETSPTHWRRSCNYDVVSNGAEEKGVDTRWMINNPLPIVFFRGSNLIIYCAAAQIW